MAERHDRRRRKGKVKSIKQYLRADFNAVERAKVLANPRIWGDTEPISRDKARVQRLKLRVRGQVGQVTPAQASHERDTNLISHSAKRQLATYKKVEGLIDEVQSYAPKPKWLEIVHQKSPTRRKQPWRAGTPTLKHLTPPRSRSNAATAASSSVHSVQEITTPRVWLPRTPIKHLDPSVIQAVTKSFGGTNGGKIEKSLIELHKSCHGKPAEQSRLASLEWFTYRYPILLQRDKFVESQAVVTIGKAWRAYLARQAYKSILKLVRTKAVSATSIQKWWRYILWVKHRDAAIMRLKHTVAFLAIQTAVRNINGIFLKEKRDEEEREKVRMRKIQAEMEEKRRIKRNIWLAENKRRRLQIELAKKKEEGAVSFQVCWHAYRFRMDIQKMIDVRNLRWKCAINVQKRVRAKLVQRKFHEIYAYLKELMTQRIRNESAQRIQRVFLYYRGRKWAPRSMLGIYIRDITRADYEIPSPKHLHRWIFVDDPDYIGYRRFNFGQIGMHNPHRHTSEGLRAKRLLKAEIEYASTCHMIGMLRSASDGWKQLVERMVGNEAPSLRSVAYVSQLICAYHSAGKYEEAEPWMAICMKIVQELEARKLLAERFRLRVLCTPCWRVFMLLFIRAKKRKVAAAKHFAILTGKKMLDAFHRWNFYTMASAFDNRITCQRNFRVWKTKARALARVRKFLAGAETNTKRQVLLAWQVAAFESRRDRWVIRAAQQFAQRHMMLTWLRGWKAFWHYRRTVRRAIERIESQLLKFKSEAMRIWKWFPSPMMEKWAALKIQSFCRMYLGKKRWMSCWKKKRLAQLNEEEAAAERAILDAAAAKLQGMWRMKKAWGRRLERVLFLIEEKKLKQDRIKELLFEFQEVKEELSYIGSTPDTTSKLLKRAQESAAYAEKARKGLKTSVRKEKESLKGVIKKTAPKLVKVQVAAITKEIRAEGKLLDRPTKKIEAQVRQAVNMFKLKAKTTREDAYKKYMKYVHYQEQNKKDIERYAFELEAAEKAHEEFKKLDDEDQVIVKIKEARQQIQDDAAKKITAFYRGNMIYKKCGDQRKLKDDIKRLKEWAAGVIACWWRRMCAVVLADDKRDHNTFEAERQRTLKIVRMVRKTINADPVNAGVHERRWLRKLARIGITEDRLEQAEEKVTKVIAKVRMTEKTMEKVERRLRLFPPLFRLFGKYYPETLKPFGWGKPNLKDPVVLLERFFSDMHEVILDFPAMGVPFKEDGAYAYLTLKLAVKRTNRLMSKFKGAVFFDVYTLAEGIVQFGGKYMVKPVTFKGFVSPGGSRELPPQMHGVWKVPIFHKDHGWLRQSANREKAFNFSNATIGGDTTMSMQAILKQLEEEQLRLKVADAAKKKLREDQIKAAEEGKLKALRMSKFRYLDILDEPMTDEVAYEILGGEIIIDRSKSKAVIDEEEFLKRQAAEALALELAKVPPMEGEIDKGSEEVLALLARSYGKAETKEHFSEFLFCKVCADRKHIERPAARLCHRCEVPYCYDCWYACHRKRGPVHNYTKLEPYHNELKEPQHEKDITILEERKYMLFLQNADPQRFAKMQFQMKWKWSMEEMNQARQLFIDTDKSRNGRIGINPAATIARIILGKRSDEMPVIKMSLLKAWQVNQIPEAGISFSEFCRMFVPFNEYLKINMRERLKLKVASHGKGAPKIDLGKWTAARNKNS
jgi:hypothetical protein